MSGQTFSLPETMRINGLAEIKDQLTPLVVSGEDLEFDGADVSSMDTSGIQLIIAAHLSLSKQGKKLTLKNPSAAINKALDICGAENLLDIT